MFTRHPDLLLIDAINLAFYESYTQQRVMGLMEKDQERQRRVQ